jgi:hypothetical protein
MIDRTKKQTNLGIILAIIGFTMIGGALVLIPKLVDQKIKSLRLHEPAIGVSDTTATRRDIPVAKKSNIATSAGVQPPDTVPAETGADDGANDKAQSGSVGAEAPAGNTPGTEAPESAIGGTGPWELVLADRYEPDTASKTRLQAIIEKMKTTPGMRLKIVGINNINKTSKLAQIGANRIQALILKESGAIAERTETAVEQQPDIKGIRVRVISVGGVQ